MTSVDYYAVMGVSQTATEKDIKAAYRRLARQYHPDLNKGPDAEEKFKALQEAYAVLKDPVKRKAYDQGTLNTQQGFSQEYYTQPGYAQSPGGYQFYSNVGDAPFDDSLFESLFGHQQQTRHESTLHISLEEAYHGTEKMVQWLDGKTKRTLKINIPPGAFTGQVIRIAAHHLYLTIEVKKHHLFDVKGQDLYLTLPVSPWEVALGTRLNVPTLGGSVELKIPAHSQGGKMLRLKHRGLPGKVQGDQYILLKVVVPSPKTAEEEALYEQMKTLFVFDPRASFGSAL